MQHAIWFQAQTSFSTSLFSNADNFGAFQRKLLYLKSTNFEKIEQNPTKHPFLFETNLISQIDIGFYFCLHYFYLRPEIIFSFKALLVLNVLLYCKDIKKCHLSRFLYATCANEFRLSIHRFSHKLCF